MVAISLRGVGVTVAVVMAMGCVASFVWGEELAALVRPEPPIARATHTTTRTIGKHRTQTPSQVKTPSASAASPVSKGVSPTFSTPDYWPNPTIYPEATPLPKSYKRTKIVPPIPLDAGYYGFPDSDLPSIDSLSSCQLARRCAWTASPDLPEKVDRHPEFKQYEDFHAKGVDRGLWKRLEEQCWEGMARRPLPQLRRGEQVCELPAYGGEDLWNITRNLHVIFIGDSTARRARGVLQGHLKWGPKGFNSPKQDVPHCVHSDGGTQRHSSQVVERPDGSVTWSTILWLSHVHDLADPPGRKALKDTLDGAVMPDGRKPEWTLIVSLQAAWDFGFLHVQTPEEIRAWTAMHVQNMKYVQALAGPRSTVIFREVNHLAPTPGHKNYTAEGMLPKLMAANRELRTLVSSDRETDPILFPVMDWMAGTDEVFGGRRACAVSDHNGVHLMTGAARHAELSQVMYAYQLTRKHCAGA